MKQGKVWGQTQPLFNKNNVEIHRIEINKGGYCSEHIHEYKYNMFFVEAGKLEIHAWKSDYDLCDITIIQDNEMTVVKPGDKHKFVCLEDTIAYEIYWVELLENDIKRSNCGGTES